MSEPIRLLHFADLHIGMENYGRIDPTIGTSSRVRDFLDRMDEVIDYALEHDADLAVFAGDAFKTRNPEPTQQREFARRIKRLADVVPTLLLVGNHDMPGMAAKANSLDIFSALDVPGMIVGDEPDGRVIETQRGPIFLAWMPYPMRNRLLSRDEHKGKSIMELEVALRETVADIVGDLADKAESHDMPRVLACHFSVAEASFGSERSVMLGRDVAVFVSTLADPRWDYVALGHIHKHQSLNPGKHPPVIYSGSLERIDFGEEAERKGFCWAEVTRGETQWSFVPVDARPFHTIKVDVRQAQDPTAAVLDAIEGSRIEGAVVRVMIQLRADQEAMLREGEIKNKLTLANHVTIARSVDVESRSRLGISGEGVHELTPLELVERYFKSRDVDHDRLELLMVKAEELINDPH